jgi:hypothetical protein
MDRTACTEPQCLYKGALYLYLWSWKSRAIPLLPLWTVLPVQNLSAFTRVHFTFTFGHEKCGAIPLLPLWTVRPVQSLSAFTRVHFSFGHEMVELHLYSHYGPYGLYRASAPVKGWPLPFFTSKWKTKCDTNTIRNNRYMLTKETCYFGK